MCSYYNISFNNIINRAYVWRQVYPRRRTYDPAKTQKNSISRYLEIKKSTNKEQKKYKAFE